MAHRVKQPWRVRLATLSPFGLANEDKPKHYREALDLLSKNRGNLRYALRLLKDGVCDSCPLGVAGFHDWTIGEPHVCLKRLESLRTHTMPPLNHKMLAGVSEASSMSDDELRRLGRLAHPMRRRRGEPGFTRVTWEEAYQRIADQINDTEPNRLAFSLADHDLSDEAYYVAQKVARFFGTNNIDTAGHLTRDPTAAAMTRGIGTSAATCSYSDFWDSDLVIFFDASPATDQPVMTNYLRGARGSGARVVMVGPQLDEEMYRYWVPTRTRSALFGSKMTDYWFPTQAGGIAAFLYGVIRVMIERDWCDNHFIGEHTTGFEELKQRAEHIDWSTLEQQAGVDHATMVEFAELLHKASKAVFVWPIGAGEHQIGAGSAQMIVNLALSKGYVGRASCGLMPMPRHAGLPGAMAMGAAGNALPGHQPLNAQTSATLASKWDFPVPQHTGMSAAEMLEAADRGGLSLLYCVGGNFLASGPDQKTARRAMERVPLRVHQDLILTEQMFIESKTDAGEVLILPAKTIYEQTDGATQTSAERRVMFSPELPREVGETRSHPRILRDIAATVSSGSAVQLGCASGEAIRNEIASVIPAYHGMQYLANVGDAIQAGGPRLCEGWRFPTPDGKAHFQIAPLAQMPSRSSPASDAPLADPSAQV